MLNHRSTLHYLQRNWNGVEPLRMTLSLLPVHPIRGGGAKEEAQERSSNISMRMTMWNWGWEIWWHILDGSTCILDSYNVWIALNDLFIYWEHSHPDIRFIIYRHTCEDEIGCWCYIHEAFSLLQRHGKQWLPLENLKLLYFGALHHAKASSTSYPGIDYLTR